MSRQGNREVGGVDKEQGTRYKRMKRRIKKRL